MGNHARRVCFLAYYSPHIKLFQKIKAALPSDIRADLKLVYGLTPKSICFSSTPPDDIPMERFAQMTVPYGLKKLCGHPELDTPAWHRRMEKRAVQWYRLFLSELRDVDLVVSWNGFAIPLAAAAEAAQRLGKHIIYCENGVLPGMIAMDTRGVNYDCSLTGRDADFYASFPYEDAEAEKLFETVWPQRPLRTSLSKADSTLGPEDQPLPERYILYAMQVNEDSQIQLFSPRFHNMWESVAYVHQQVAEHNRRTGDSVSLVVKEHPSDYGKADYTELRASMPEVRFLRTTPIRDLLKTAQALITVNSSVAIEGMFYDLPIVTMGHAFYNVRGLVRHLDASEELADILPSLLSKPIDRNLRRHFLCFLWNRYLVPHPDRDPSGATRGAQRIMDVLEERLPW